MTIATHATLAPADGHGYKNHDRQRRKPKVKQQFIGLVIRGLAVVAADVNIGVIGNEAALQLGNPVHDALGNDDGVGSGALGKSNRDSWSAFKCTILRPRELPGPVLERLCADDDVRNIAHINRPAIARGQQQKSDVRNALQSLASLNRKAAIIVSYPACKKSTVRLLDLVDQLRQSDPVERQSLGIGLHTNLIGSSANDVGETDVF